MNKSVYLDSTIPSYLFDERAEIQAFIDITKKWWKEEQKNFDLWISEETVVELSKGDYPNKRSILECISEIQVLPFDEQLVDITQIYLDNLKMPQVLAGDALHLAYVSHWKIDFLLTWNCNHLANANKKQHIRVINTRLNLFTPEIITPLELFTETTDGN